MAEEFLTDFNFAVHLTLSGLGGDESLIRDPRGAFSEVSGLEYQIELTAIREGGYNLGSRQLVAKTSSPEIVLKRGLSLDSAFWQWIQRCTSGSYPLPYISGTIEVYGAGENRQRQTPAVWKFSNGIATRVKAADLNAASSSAVPIEELHIAHEQLQRVGA